MRAEAFVRPALAHVLAEADVPCTSTRHACGASAITRSSKPKLAGAEAAASLFEPSSQLSYRCPPLSVVWCVCGGGRAQGVRQGRSVSTTLAPAACVRVTSVLVNACVALPSMGAARRCME